MANERVSRRKFVRDGAAAAAGVTAALSAAQGADPDKTKDIKSKILNYNENMEYRRLGKTGLMIGAVSMGGHWKQIEKVVPGVLKGKGWLSADLKHPSFVKNRHDVVSACIDAGINYIDACTGNETCAYAEALRGRRDKMYLGYSWYEHEMRFKNWQTAKKLLEGIDASLQQAKLDYVDIWRITCYWTPKQKHTEAHEHAIVEALDKAKKAGKVRFRGFSTHKHDWAIHMMDTYPEQIEVIVVPYTAGSKKAHRRVEPGKGGWQAVPDDAVPQDKSSLSLIDAVKRNNVGWFGIKPFASGTVFRSRGTPHSATKKDDDDRARLTLRYVLCNDALTAPIPGLLTVDQVKNAALAVTERRKLDRSETRRLDEATTEMWANLPQDYQWLKQWEWV